MHLGFSGTRHGMTQYQYDALADLLERYHDAESFHHGDCMGADAQAHACAAFARIPRHIHPPDNPKLRAYCVGGVRYKPLPYRARNEAIVQACDLLIAAPATMDEHARSGTWMTIRYARHCGKQVVILPPEEGV